MPTFVNSLNDRVTVGLYQRRGKAVSFQLSSKTFPTITMLRLQAVDTGEIKNRTCYNKNLCFLVHTRIRIANGATLSRAPFLKVGLVLVKAAKLTAKGPMDRKLLSFYSLLPVHLQPALEGMSREERGEFFLQILLVFEFRNRCIIQDDYEEYFKIVLSFPTDQG